MTGTGPDTGRGSATFRYGDDIEHLRHKFLLLKRYKLVAGYGKLTNSPVKDWVSQLIH
jgi:hypothetical protein